jgi:hypothetical protein
VALATALVVLTDPAQAAGESNRPMCPNEGYISDRLVPTAPVAIEIYKAVARAVSPNILKRYPIVTVADEGDHWHVSQTNNNPLPKPTPNTVIVTAGGGQLNMDIDKCTGAISHAALNR